ncbi:ANTAR domain-containing protein [Mumia sp. DW29H23]|uniref:ANTAR domain-containing protein n=1 Tax=Mumia sp. DW29H23 TaxID=3421241 RepID=UPI003D6803A1
MEEQRLDQHELVSIVEELHSADSLQETADQVVSYLRDALEMDAAGVTLLRSAGRLETVAATSDVITRIDAIQDDLREGPWLSPEWDQTLRVGDLARELRWPRWTSTVSALGFAGLLAVDLPVQGRRIGVVSLYSRAPRSFDEDDAALAHLFARHAAVALARADREAHLQLALDSRKLIGQAQGILMERFGLDEARAFEVLKRYSQHHNLRLRTLAELLVQTRTLPPIG